MRGEAVQATMEWKSTAAGSLNNIGSAVKLNILQQEGKQNTLIKIHSQHM